MEWTINVFEFSINVCESCVMRIMNLLWYVRSSWFSGIDIRYNSMKHDVIVLMKFEKNALNL